MHIAQHAPGIGAEKPLQRVADDCRAQMTDVHRFCDIGAAEIDDEQFSEPRFRSGQTRIGRHVRGPEDKRVVGYVEIDKSRTGNLHLRKDAVVAKSRRDTLGNGARRGFGELRCSERAVALKLCEIGAIGNLHHSKRRIETFFGERPAGGRRQFRNERRHG